MFVNVTWWAMLLVYGFTMLLVGFAFQWIDWEKIMQKEHKRMYWVIYMIAVLCATFMIGTLILIIMNQNYLG